MEQIGDMKKKMGQGENPMIFKKQLAFGLTKQFNNEKSANKAQNEFETRFQKGELNNAELPTKKESDFMNATSILDTLVLSGITESNSAARRLIEQKAVKINGILVGSSKDNPKLKQGDIIRAGRKAIKINT